MALTQRDIEPTVNKVKTDHVAVSVHDCLLFRFHTNSKLKRILPYRLPNNVCYNRSLCAREAKQWSAQHNAVD